MITIIRLYFLNRKIRKQKAKLLEIENRIRQVIERELKESRKGDIDMATLVVIADGLFSHAYAKGPVYIVDLDGHAEDPARAALYDPESDCQMAVDLEEVDNLFGTEFETEFA